MAMLCTAALAALLMACGGSDDPVSTTADAPLSTPNPAKFFNRTALVAVCKHIGSSCESDTANEGDLSGGSRSFTVFKADGTAACEPGHALDHLMARIGHNNDKRSDARGNEPANAAFGCFESTDDLFMASERSSVVVVHEAGRCS
jgi:hypothetical protein